MNPSQLDQPLRQVIIDTLAEVDLHVADWDSRNGGWRYREVNAEDAALIVDAIEAKLIERNMFGRSVLPWKPLTVSPPDGKVAT